MKLKLDSVCAAPIAKLDDYNCNSLSEPRAASSAETTIINTIIHHNVKSPHYLITYG